MGLQLRTVTRWVVLHHSATSPDTTVEAIRRYHTAPPPAGRGFCDVGYHWFVLADGEIVAGRPETAIGAHCRGINGQSVGVCLVGHFSDGVAVEGSPRVLPPDAQWRAALDLVADVCRRHGLDHNRVIGHRETAQTLCPGFSAYPFREALREILHSSREVAP